MLDKFIVCRGQYETDIGLVLYDNIDGGTLKILTLEGKIFWVVRSACEVIGEGR